MSDVYWLNAVSGSFTNATDWSSGTVPGRSDTAILNAPGEPYTVTFASETNEELGSLQVAANATLNIASGGFNVGDVENSGAILINSGFATQGELNNSGVIEIAGSALQHAFLAADAPLTLTGGGSVTLGDSEKNSFFGGELTNADNMISGAGKIKVSFLDNAAQGVIDASDSFALSINTSSTAITNAGTIETTGSGGAVVKSAIVNTGVLKASVGILTFYRAVSGAGVAVIDGGILNFQSSFSEAVTFTSGGTLELAHPKGFDGTVTGFSKMGATTLDLRGIGFVSGDEATFSGSKKGGVLTVTDGTRTATIAFAGNYLDATFVCSSDGHGGTDVVAHKITATAVPLHAFIAAAACFGSPAAFEARFGQTHNNHGPLLASPRFAIG